MQEKILKESLERRHQNSRYTRSGFRALGVRGSKKVSIVNQHRKRTRGKAEVGERVQPGNNEDSEPASEEACAMSEKKH